MKLSICRAIFIFVLTSSSKFTLECQFPTSGMRTTSSSRTHSIKNESETILSQFLSLSEWNAYEVKHCQCSKRQTSHKFHLATKHSYTQFLSVWLPFPTPLPRYHSFRFFRSSVKTNKCFHCVESLLVYLCICASVYICFRIWFTFTFYLVCLLCQDHNEVAETVMWWTFEEAK